MQGPANETAAGQLDLDTRMHLDAACQRKHPAEILALGPSCAFHLNSLCGRNSAGSSEICATYQRIFWHDISEFEPRSRVSVGHVRSVARKGNSARSR